MVMLDYRLTVADIGVVVVLAGVGLASLVGNLNKGNGNMPKYRSAQSLIVPENSFQR